jgi:type IV pilus assembly protein PilW
MRERGLTLIEMMISITIGLIIMIAIIAMFAGSTAAGRMAEAQGRMNEDAQAALTILTQQIRMVGSNPKQPNRTVANPRNPVFGSGTYMVRGCDGRFSDVATAATLPALTCANTATDLPDSIAVRYEADRYNTVPTAAGGTPTDCLGSSLTASTSMVVVHTGTAAATTTANFVATYYVADNRFYITTSSVVTSPSLYCKGSGTTNPQPLVENIEDLQFTYGTSPARASTGTVAGYLDAVGVETDSNVDLTGTALSALPGSPARWARVVTARICVIARSELPVVTSNASAQYIDCQGTLRTPTDNRLRKAYHTTVVLRNRILY